MKVFQRLRRIEQHFTQLAFAIGDDFAGFESREGGYSADAQGSDAVVERIGFTPNKQLLDGMVLEVAEQKNIGSIKMTAGVTTSIHVQIRSQVRIHRTAVLLVIREEFLPT